MRRQEKRTEVKMMRKSTSLRRRAAAALAVAALVAGSAAPATAQESGGTVKRGAAEKLPNVPGKSITAVMVSYPPGGKSGAHRHAGSVLAYVLSGAIRS